MTSVINIDGHQLLHSLQDQGEMESKVESSERACGNHGGICAICLDKIVLQETALVKGCEHAYCVKCILRWSTYTKNPTCPQCKHPFEFLNIHRSLDGSIQDYMFEESVCLLLRASWFMTLTVEDHEDVYEDPEDYYPYEFEDEDDDDDLDEVYLSSSSNLRIGNRSWGDNGYVRAGHQEARPVYQADFKDSGRALHANLRRKRLQKIELGDGRRGHSSVKLLHQNMSSIWQGWAGSDSLSISVCFFISQKQGTSHLYSISML